jgi:uncharacterized protein (TIGR00369 family)
VLKICAPPDGFKPVIGSADGFDTVSGPYYACLVDAVPVIGMRILSRHLNSSGTCHGGVLAVLADYQGSIVRCIAGLSGHATPTVTLSIDFMAPVQPGTWLTLHCQLLRRTRNLLFSGGHLDADGTMVARIDGIYKIGPPAPGRPPGNMINTL